jgi:hypothetical protein
MMSKLGTIVAVLSASLGLTSLGLTSLALTASAAGLPASTPAASPVPPPRATPPIAPPTKPTGCPVGGGIHATTPPELQLLEQKIQQLKIRTARFSSRLAIGTSDSDSTLELTVTGEIEHSPSESQITTNTVIHKRSGPGAHEVTMRRQIGDTRYTYNLMSSRGDGGRPWVREHLTRGQIKAEGKEGKPGEIDAGPFAIGLLGIAQSIEATGPATLDGRTVEQFNLTFAPGEYPAKELPFEELLENEFCQPTVNVSLSIDPAGVPVSATVNATYNNSKRTITTSLSFGFPAINFPFTPLKAPPAKQTIGEAALRKLESKRRSRELRKLERGLKLKRRKTG